MSDYTRQTSTQTWSKSYVSLFVLYIVSVCVSNAFDERLILITNGKNTFSAHHTELGVSLSRSRLSLSVCQKNKYLSLYVCVVQIRNTDTHMSQSTISISPEFSLSDGRTGNQWCSSIVCSVNGNNSCRQYVCRFVCLIICVSTHTHASPFALPHVRISHQSPHIRNVWPVEYCGHSLSLSPQSRHNSSETSVCEEQ